MGGAQRYPSISVSAAKLMGFAALYPSYGRYLAGRRLQFLEIIFMNVRSVAISVFDGIHNARCKLVEI